MASLFKKHPLAVLLSLIIHGALGGFMVFGMDFFETEAISVPAVNTVKATVIDESQIKALAEKKRKIEEKARQDKQKILDDIKQKELEKQKAIDDAKAKEAARKAKIKKDIADKEKAKKAKAETARKKKVQDAKDRADNLKAIQETAKREEAEKAIASIVSVIQAKVERNWIQPVGNISGLKCLVEVRLIPGGTVVSAVVKQSSGNALFDRSVVQATLKASPLPLPADPSLMSHFRKLQFLFDPSKQ